MAKCLTSVNLRSRPPLYAVLSTASQPLDLSRRQRKHYARLWRTRRGEGSSNLGLWEVEFGDTIAERGGRGIIDEVKAAEVADSTRIGKGIVREVEPARNGDHNVGNVGFESGGSDDR